MDDPIHFSDDQYKSLKRAVAVLQDTVDKTNSDLVEDRTDIDDLKTRQAKIEAQGEAVYGRIERLEKTMKDIMADAVEKEIKSQLGPVKRILGDVVKQEQKVVVREVKRPSLFKRLFKRR